VASPTAKNTSVWPWLVGGAAVILVMGGLIAIGFLWLLPKQPLKWHLVLEVQPGSQDRAAVVNQTVAVIEGRLNAAGVPRFEVRPDGDASSGRILINLPSVQDPERIKQLVSSQGKLELVQVVSLPNPVPVKTYESRESADAEAQRITFVSNRRVLPYSREAGTPTQWVIVESPAIVDGSDVRDARAAPAPVGDGYDIHFSLNQTGAGKFGSWTEANTNNYLGVVLNDEVKSIAFIKSRITDQGTISGRFTKQSAEDLALVLRSGALPAPVKIASERIDP
jgi:preprotein translocase subunit SecD